MNVIDSSAWIEYFADAPNAAFFAPAIADLKDFEGVKYRPKAK